ncbi:response regulator, partial [Aquisalimonas sp.]|uniref:response regulator n=1 Tax=Aquisalimonas sp. TaxID=1872621 RepID=UPI0025B89E30
PGYGLLGVALLGQLGADIGFGATTLAGTFAYGHPLFAGWLLLYACAGAAVLHPGMARMTEPAAAAKPTLGSGRLLSLTGAALVPIVILLVQSQRGELQDVALIAMLTAVVFLLVIWRLYALAASVHEHERQQAKLKSQFTAAVSHELRTPLTAIHGALGLMAGGVAGELPGKACRLVDIARSNSGRLVRLINDILDLERFESGRAELRPTACPAAELAERAVEDLRPVADAAGVELRVRAEPAVVWADADRILQTLTNLLGNAIKFSDTGPAVEIRVASRDAQIRFEVRDEGRGIPPDKLETVFGRFEQVDASDMRAKGGTGLGLAICRTIVEQHGGRIWAENAPGAGSVFTFELPQAYPRTSPSTATGGPLVVVCDDDPGVLEITGELLTAHGYRVLPALSGNAALALIAEHAPEAVVLDLVMPGADGWEVAAQLRERPETAAIPIIILSVVTRGEEPEPAGGVCAWLDKPLDEDILLAALRRAVATQGRPPRLLLVEDDAGLAEILAGSFARHGLETIIAGTGAQALARAEQVPPDLIILDLALPEVDGYRVVEALQQRPWLRRAPLVVYSASDLDDQDRARLRLGETSFFTKGRVTPEAFERHVIGILERMIHQEGAR